MHPPAASPHAHARYRPHIDGLRAIAVMGVLLFHFGATWLPGGFVGVDVFFVISGFVISKSLYRDVGVGRFSIISFYERRIRRIFPALFVVTSITSVAAYFLLFNTDLVSYAKSVIASILFSSNIYFYFESGYFAQSAIRIPLLHYWSLGVEEQFYVLFPLIVVGVYRWNRNALPWVLGFLAAASLIACEVVRRSDPALAFYWLPFRAFELLCGCLLALNGVRFPKNRIISAMLVAIGVCLIVGSMLLIEESMPFPGLLCIPPCLGAALVIYGGDGISTLPSRLLGSRPFLFIGAISFSLYLVHWPIVVFARMMHPDMPANWLLLGGMAASVVLAWLSYVCVEQPFRTNTAVFTRPRIFAGAAVSASLLLIAGGVAVWFDGLPGRLSPEIKSILAYAPYPYSDEFREGTCFLLPDQTGADIAPVCLPQHRPSLVIWGDSSIAQYYWGMAPLLKERGIAFGQLTASACPPLPGIEIPSRPNCKPFNDFALAEILKTRPDTVVLGAVWTVSAQELTILDRTIDQMVAAGIRVVVLGPPSFYTTPGPIVVATRRMAGNSDGMAKKDLNAAVSIQRDSVMRAHFNGNAKAKYISVNGVACQPDCTLAIGNVPLHFDVLHLTREGSDFYASKLVPAILE